MCNYKELLEKSNLNLSDEMVSQFETFYNFLIEYNSHTNLTRIVEKDAVYYLHFLDSLYCSKAIDKDEFSLLDVGSGAGFPGMPLKIAYPKMKLSVIESINKKLEFQRQLSEKIGLTNVTFNHTRAEDFKEFEKYDYATARAVAPLKELIEYTVPFLKIGGKFISMKSLERAEEEIKESKDLLKKIGAVVENQINYQILDRNYCLIVIKKINKTPKNYPKPIHK